MKPESSGGHILAAQAEHLAQIVRIEQETPDAPHWPLETYAAILDQEPSSPLQRRLLVAINSDRLVGFAVGRLLRIADDTEAELESIAVSAEFRQTGVGRALCQAVVGWATEFGVKEMQLEVRVSNVAARTFYKRLGWVEDGLRKAYYQHPVEDAVSMTFSIG